MEIVLVNVWEGVGAHVEAQQFCELWGIEGTVLVDEEGELARRIGIRGVPTNVFVDSDGTVTEVGAVTPDELESATRRLLGPQAEFEPRGGAGWLPQKDQDEMIRNKIPGSQP